MVVLHISLHLCFGQYIDGPVRGESRSLSPQNWCFEISWKLTYGWFGFSPLHTYACSTKISFHHIDTMQPVNTWHRPWRARNRSGSIESFTSARSWWNRRRNCESCSTKSIWTLGQLGQLAIGLSFGSIGGMSSLWRGSVSNGVDTMKRYYIV